MLDLYVCLRPVQYFKGVPSPVKHPEKVDMVIFRENTEDIYAGIEYAAGTPEAQKVLDFLEQGISEGVRQDPFRHEGEGGGILESGRRAGEGSTSMVGIGIKPVSRSGSVRLIHSAIAYAIQNQRKSVTFVHKGNIMKFTEGAFRDWGYEVAKRILRRRGNRRRPVVQNSRRANRAAASSSRTRSPTSPCNRCSRARKISMSSRR